MWLLLWHVVVVVVVDDLLDAVDLYAQTSALQSETVQDGGALENVPVEEYAEIPVELTLNDHSMHILHYQYRQSSNTTTTTKMVKSR